MPADRPPTAERTTPSGIHIAYWPNGDGSRAGMGRHYKVNGVKVPSVSKIADILDFGKSSGMAYSAADLTKQGLDYQEEWNKASTAGTELHDQIIEKFLMGASFPDTATPHFKAAAKWLIDCGFQLLQGEEMVASAEYGFAGRFDLLGSLKTGETARVDFKTRSKKFRKLDQLTGSEVQLELYELAAEESGDPTSDVRLLVELDPLANYRVTRSTATRDDALAYIDVYRRRKAHEQRQKEAA